MFRRAAGHSGSAEVRAFGLTDTGKRRRGHPNQDRILQADLLQGQVFAVADGMGGHVAGDLAARLALDTYLERLEQGREPLDQRTIHAAEAANRAVVERAVGELLGMGTTLLSAVIVPGAVYLTHVGDSRAYLLRQSRLYRLTDDHSWVSDQLRAGELSAEEAQAHRWRNVVSNALGGEATLRLELLGLELQQGDRLLLCTDGLYGPVSDEKLLALLELPRSPERVAQTLIAQANQAGGPDNISAVVIDVVQPGGRPPHTCQGAKFRPGPGTAAAKRVAPGSAGQLSHVGHGLSDFFDPGPDAGSPGRGGTDWTGPACHDAQLQSAPGQVCAGRSDSAPRSLHWMCCGK
ncbi:PP2C family protein-serine/threonine phosphatase [Deinococcus radiophilus]|uniref:PP2C family protein-serine/threonine phosphatase n=1 Tax=Deinococcus radiophilus TaxID=32062 RepID=UPI0036198D9E